MNTADMEVTRNNSGNLSKALTDRIGYLRGGIHIIGEHRRGICEVSSGFPRICQHYLRRWAPDYHDRSFGI